MQKLGGVGVLVHSNTYVQQSLPTCHIYTASCLVAFFFAVQNSMVPMHRLIDIVM